MSIESIKLKNFTIFENLKVDFSKGINVIIGENGTGKTQLIKAIYANLQIAKSKNIDDISKYFKAANINDRFFVRQLKPLLLELKVSGIENRCDKNYLMGKSQLDVNGINTTAGSDDECSYEIAYPSKEVECTFIPAKDMLTHSKGFVSMADKFSEFPFDKTLVDIIKVAGQWQLKQPPKIALKILPMLEKMMKGKVVFENEEFYIKKDNGDMVDFAVEAEGLKKIGLLWQLLMNENITSHSVLLWDEPEANINPKFIPNLVEILLELQKNGVQIFITTHDYIFAKYFDVKRSDDDVVMYYSLYKTDDGVECENNVKFGDLKNNTIMDTFIQLYKDEVERAMK
ncbi:AAA family ATPase [Clostridium frigidicarnis]|uniref:AAA domain-containing protein, putative AbiEii toxin, Type IV TA system n=1 Tax=Clostridium frigidicarnis TaxID=84698 RepID=A0A1I0Y5L1_9CLOT|nr:ATP-binding protein [Clostridium frigidicarnis]SFB08046.1 AAA domain-containing protein, putative AbiEii toxin, Type IV TA system [Clostridium frigidicarnis]